MSSRATNADLALSGLTKRYGGNAAVDQVTLRIASGEMVALLGPSGCGKTTTLRMIAGLITPTDGTVLIGGADVTQVPVHRRNIGMLFQNYALFPHMTIAQNVAFGLEMRGLRKAEIVEKVTRALSLVQLEHLAARHPSALSGGQQQRVALARAIVIEPSLLLLDEPLGALDKNLRESMQSEIRQIQQRLGITAVMVTHDQDEAMTMADRIVIMRDGKLEQIGTPAEIYEQPVSKFVAGFIGASNFLPGKVTSTEAGNATVALDGGGTAHVSKPLTAGERCLICVRPEAVDLLPATDAASVPNQLPCKVNHVIYRGQTTHVHLTLNDGSPFVACFPNRDDQRHGVSLEVGSSVVASWAIASGRAVSE